MGFSRSQSLTSQSFLQQNTVPNRRWLGSIAGSALSLFMFGIPMAASLNLWTQPAAAQALPTCQPPRPDQFLLLVLDQRSDTQTQLQKLLPESAVLTACDYLSNSVVRVEGFSSAEIADAWAKYISDRIGLQAFVARSSNSAIVTTPTLSQPQNPNQNPAQSPAQPASPGNTAPGNTAPGNTTPGNTSSSSSAPATYSPQPLGAGYAVLVNYFNRPEVATDIRQITTGSVGLVAYNQYPYLLAIHTSSEGAAADLLKTLSDRGFTVVIVDSRRVMLLKQDVAN
ncbi:MAG: hypothetical protein HY785_19590 [Oscillatoriophycideae cyanobacterium NC_groundwater_1537_Pr4_S-0.65um_50_18]|nr:hypothetical protein [Oscillatoriophycideae cyanobacterium NC_groundwater_1537_Pr4_S-0.65um_50_18]